ncbi:MAG TPA: hypothetical protein VFT27_06225 [Actinomycetota bacterium]|nr:hypothetical protein [Actinomycetota bacterium]
MRRRPPAAKTFVLTATVTSAVVVGTPSAVAQVIVSPNAEPVRNDGGWIYWIAVALVALGLIVAAAIILRYMRYAPRFAREEGGPRTVKAPRIQPGREAPRRPVNITGAPAVVPAPAVAVAAPATAPAPVAASPPPAAAPAPATTPPAIEAPTPASEAPAAAAEPTASPATEAAPAPAPAPSGERKEVALDQETFDRVLAELLEKGTARRVAEGQARRAAMIAARKKAGA